MMPYSHRIISTLNEGTDRSSTDSLPEQASMQVLSSHDSTGNRSSSFNADDVFRRPQQVMTHTIDLNANHVSLEDRKVQQGKH